MNFEELLQRDLDYPTYLDWPAKNDSYHNILYTDPSNKSRIVLYRNTTVRENFRDFQRQSNFEKYTYFYKEKVHRSKGPANAEIRITSDVSFEKNKVQHGESIEVEIEWYDKGKLHRKKHPAFYAYKKINDEISSIVLEWHEKPVNKMQGSYHRLGGPAVHRYGDFFSSKIIYYIRGKKYSEYEYWLYIFKNHLDILPKIEYQTAKKVRFKKNIKKPAPTLIDFENRKVYYTLYGALGDLKKSPSSKYWDSVHLYHYFENGNLLPLK